MRAQVFVELAGVGGVPQERVSAEFSERGFDVRVRGLAGNDYRRRCGLANRATGFCFER